MILLDASGLIALLSGEPAAKRVAAILREEHEVGVVSINLAEALDVLTRRKGVPGDELRRALDPLLTDRVKLIDISAELAWRAAEVRARHYRKKTTELSLADCSFIAASMSGDTIVTKDAAVIRVAASEGLDAVNLR